MNEVNSKGNWTSLSIRVSHADRQSIKLAATQAGLSISAYVKKLHEAHTAGESIGLRPVVGLIPPANR